MRRRWNRRGLLVGALVAALGVALALVLLLGRGPPADPLTPEERAWLERHDGRIVFAPYLGAPPFTFVNTRGEFSGMGADYVLALERELGFRFHILPPAPLGEVFDRLRAGQADVTNMVAPSPERERFLRFTGTLVRVPTVIVVRRGTWDTLTVEQLRSLRVAVGERYVVREFLATNFPYLHLVPVPTDLQGLRQLVTGGVDALVADAAAVSYFIGTEQLTNLHIAGEVPFEYELAFAVRADQPVLLSILQKGLDRLDEREHRAVWRRWVEDWELPFYRERAFQQLVALSLAAFVLLLGAAAFWSATLRRQVQAKTAALAEAHRRASLLAEAGVVLSETLDIDAALRHLGELLVRYCGEWCAIDLVEDGDIRRAAGAHADPTRQPLLDEFARRFPARPGAPSPAGQALAHGRPVLLPSVTDEELLATVRSEEHAQLLRALGARTGIAVPLVARGQVLGVLTLASGVPDRHFGEAELTLAQEVARRAALAVDNARLYRQAQEAVRARDLFLGVAAHELRTPLTSIVLRLEKLRRRLGPAGGEEPGTASLSEELLRVVQQARRLSALIEQLLDVARLAARRFELNLEEVDLGRLVQEVSDSLREQLDRSGSRLDLRAGGDVHGWWDRLRMEQVVGNLLSNAIKFGQGKPIEVKVEADATRARLTVCDHGIGMSEEARARVFEKFERAVSERHYGGLGLGLYITREIVEAHGGSIAVESAPGRGTTFTVVLPRERL